MKRKYGTTSPKGYLRWEKLAIEAGANEPLVLPRVDEMKERQPTDPSGHVHVRGIDVGKRDRRPHELRCVNLDGSENTGDQTHQHGRVKDVLSRVLGFF